MSARLDVFDRVLIEQMFEHPCVHVRRDAARKLGERWACDALREMKQQIKKGRA